MSMLLMEKTKPSFTGQLVNGVILQSFPSEVLMTFQIGFVFNGMAFGLLNFKSQRSSGGELIIKYLPKVTIFYQTKWLARRRFSMIIG